MTIRGNPGSYNWSKPWTSRRHLSAAWTGHQFKATTFSVWRMFRSWCWESLSLWSKSWTESDYDSETTLFSRSWSDHQ